MPELLSNKTLYGFELSNPDRRFSDGRPNYDVKALWDRQHEIINLHSMGYKNTEISKMLGVTKLTVSNAINSTLGKKAAVMKREDREAKYEELREEVLELTEKALGVYREIFEEPRNSGVVSMKMKKDTADTIMLELSGMRAAQKIESRSINTTLTPEQLAELKDRGLRAMRANGSIVEVPGESKADRDKS